VLLVFVGLVKPDDIGVIQFLQNGKFFGVVPKIFLSVFDLYDLESAKSTRIFETGSGFHYPKMSFSYDFLYVVDLVYVLIWRNYILEKVNLF